MAALTGTEPTSISQVGRSYICEKLALTLGTNPEAVKLDRYQLDTDDLRVFCWGSYGRAQFFAKMFLEENCRFRSPIMVPTKETAFKNIEVRPVKEQIDIEWNATNQLRTLAGEGNVPAVLAKSHVTKTIVWEQASGRPASHFLTWSRIVDPKGKALSTVMFSAGAWLRKVHDAFPCRREEEIDLSHIGESIPHLLERQESGKYRRIAADYLAKALVIAGKAPKTSLPIVFSHGDFWLGNLLWDQKLNQLSIIDFELSGDRNICYDLAAIVFSLRARLLNPFVPKRIIELSEKYFWQGYGQLANEILTCVDAIVSLRILCGVLARLSMRKDGPLNPQRPPWRRGWLAGATTRAYRRFFEDYVVSRRLGNI